MRRRPFLRRLHRLILGGALVGGALGCGSGEPVPTGPPPLTVEEWKTLPVVEKFDPSTFERLQDADPKLRSPAAWDKFMAEVVVPEWKKDVPSKPRYGR